MVVDADGDGGEVAAPIASEILASTLAKSGLSASGFRVGTPSAAAITPSPPPSRR